MDAKQVAAAVRARRALAEDIFDTLRAATFDGVGITRASYGHGEQFAHELLRRRAGELGLEIATDAAGNSYMTLPGRDRSAKRTVIGSHLDSVAQGGNFDGAAGVIAGLTALAALADLGWRPAGDVSVMGIRAEESAWFGVSYIGSRSALGTLPAGALDEARRADTGRTLAEHMAECGGDPDGLREAPPYLEAQRLAAYLELHIEQGPVLEEMRLPVGIVTGIRGNLRVPAARCIGEYSHCGGVPRSHRRDAAIAVADLVTGLDRIWDACEADGRDFAFTVGKMSTDAARHAMTIIAGQVDFSVDMRSLDVGLLDEMEARIQDMALEIAARRRVRFDLGRFTRAAPGILDDGIKARLRAGATAMDIAAMDIPSGASHDAAAFAAAGVPTAMIFVRNANGSHNPDEAMEIDDFMHGVELLAWYLADGK
ncbi:MAG: hydantoinase/carbamoylase family amidase [Alphaproteobacteria bacterium]